MNGPGWMCFSILLPRFNLDRVLLIIVLSVFMKKSSGMFTQELLSSLAIFHSWKFFSAQVVDLTVLGTLIPFENFSY